MASSENSGHKPEQTTSRTAQIIRSRQHDIRQLPDPDETWLLQDVPLSRRRASKLRQSGAIKTVGQVTNRGNQRLVYRVDPDVSEAVARMPEPETPCGHTGVRNLRDGAFTCTRDDCDVEFSREIAEREARR